MIKSKIEGVSFQPLKIISDERGAVLHMLQNNDPFFKNFGEIYFSEINSGFVKAWKRNKKQTQNLAVPIGLINLVIYDDRSNSETKGVLFDCTLGRPDHYNLIRIPPLLWYGFQGIGDTPALIANCADRPHNPAESEKIDPKSDFIPHIW
tara:strand:+ start:47 stop:496 length:450 start_codon:yes stop_codon:yes gene_type:complete